MKIYKKCNAERYSSLVIIHLYHQIIFKISEKIFQSKYVKDQDH